jgi:hypothetical protein
MNDNNLSVALTAGLYKTINNSKKPRKDHIFTGSLRDEELYIIEDALNAYKDMAVISNKKINNIIQKLYDFGEYR